MLKIAQGKIIISKYLLNLFILLVLFFLFEYKNLQSALRFEVTNGVVISFKIFSHGGNTYYKPIVQFSAGNSNYECVGHSMDKESFQLGSIYKTAYDPLNPEDSYLLNFLDAAGFWTVKLVPFLSIAIVSTLIFSINNIPGNIRINLKKRNSKID